MSKFKIFKSFDKLHRLGQAGDTIIEVLIVIAVLGLILAGSYAIATRSLKGVRQAQERGEALKFAESQLEMIKTAAANVSKGAVVPGANDVFCYDSPTGTEVFPELYSFTDRADITQPILSDDFDAYPKNGSNGCVKGLYHVSVKSSRVGNRPQYAVHVRWDSLGLIGREEVVMRYRLAAQDE